LDRESNYYKRTVSEMIHIKEQNISLNLNSETELLDDSYFDILDELASHESFGEHATYITYCF